METIANAGARWPEAFPAADPREAKLASDVIRFLVRACALNPEFVNRFDQLTVPHVGAAGVAAHGSRGPSEPATELIRKGASDDERTLFSPDALTSTTPID